VPRPIDTEQSKRPLLTAGSQAAREGSVERQKEFDKIVLQALPRFRRIAMRRLGNSEDAEDAVQEAMLLAFQHIAQFDGRSQMSTWLTAIVINAVRMQLRRLARRKTFSFEEAWPTGEAIISQWIADSRPSQEQNLERRELHQLVIKVTGRLPRSQRTALQLRVWHDLSIQKVASVQGVPVGTIKARLARGRAELRQRFLKSIRGDRTGVKGKHEKARYQQAIAERGRDDALGQQELQQTAFGKRDALKLRV